MPWPSSSWSCAYDDELRPDSSHVLHEPFLHVADAAGEQREVPLFGGELRLSARDVSGQPAAVRARDHQVLPALPDLHRHADCANVEPPGLHEREVVVEPAV